MISCRQVVAVESFIVLYSKSGLKERKYTFTGVVCCSFNEAVEEHLDDNLPVASDVKLMVEWRLTVSGEKLLRDISPFKEMVSERGSSFKDIVSWDITGEHLRGSSGDGRSPLRLMVSGLILELLQVMSVDALPKEEVER